MRMIDRSVLLTGANSGIGKATAAALARQGASVILACRDIAKGEAARREIVSDTGNDRIDVLLVDLASFASIRAFAAEVTRRYDKLDVLINNAGIMMDKRTSTSDGLETIMGVNHFGTFLLTGLLRDLLKASGRSRIITVSSMAHKMYKLNMDDLNNKQSYLASRAYGQSKLANILFTYELARRLNASETTANCLHPGIVRTSFAKRLTGLERLSFAALRPFMIPAEQGAATSVFLASSPNVEGVTGRYFVRCKEAPSSKRSHDRALAHRLWEESERVTGFEHR
ncbi:NAD(P)-dependent dehydrogenase, short-chain alcohol dehydrogenase family [Paenibacillus sp. UNC496MF]|uniref:SDR family oxidoreductase n=1 Tax=Paenibacillus sp. UNC496MF TaxID=1502753 RepID=UPI0008F089CD|nr:SDR family oxidoreductase [Paenibacillus sp. UNC496MF]SFJ31882.1 NAD(P)-dependent dehydrogenase, short-chain alcohol dehydrogenase family [Paenibacillus sp. UNC496MF]